MTDLTQEAALFCTTCQRYRGFRYVARRLLAEVATRTRPEIRVGARVVGHFYACTACGHEQQWGCGG